MHRNSDSPIESSLSEVLAWVLADRFDSDECTTAISELVRNVPFESMERLCSALLVELHRSSAKPIRLRLVLQNIATRLLVEQRNDHRDLDSSKPSLEVEILLQLYFRVASIDETSSAHVLQCLAAQADKQSLEAIVRCLSDHPPQEWKSVVLGLSPLWSAHGEVLRDFFERADQLLEQAVAMPVLLDLANHAVRSGRLNEHPLATQAEMLASLLKQLVARLEQLQETPTLFGDSVEQIQKVLEESVALAVSLCDALGLIGNLQSNVALLQAMQLSHRRIQTEAAAALVRLGDAEGKQRLIELAADPVARLRVIQYAEELDLAHEIDQQYRYPLALAESELVAWLSSPQQFGLPPSDIQRVDSRTLYWPGYEEPRECYLFRFRYQFPGGDFTNFGIAGPLTHAFSESLEGLAVDDVYAVFAGWHAEHDEIYEVPATSLSMAQQREAHRLEEAFQREGFQVEAKIALTFLLGETSLLAQLSRDGQNFSGITDGSETTCFCAEATRIANSPGLVLAVCRGRKLLRAFNG